MLHSSIIYGTVSERSFIQIIAAVKIYGVQYDSQEVQKAFSA